MKKIFIIAPHFPPSALPPSQRVRLIVKHLYKFGYYPYIFTTYPKYREELEDEWMNELVGDKFKEFKVKALNQKYTRKFKFGDLGIRLIPFLLPKLLKEIKKEKPDFILYPVPPWYILVIAPIINLFYKIPYAIDFIDPWVEVSLAKNVGIKRKISQIIAKIFEKKAVNKSSLVFSVSDGINNNIIKNYKIKDKNKFYSIPYGVEPSDFKLNATSSKKIIIRYIGAVWKNAYPVLAVFFKVLSEIEKDIKINIEFFGTSYAGQELSYKQTSKWLDLYNMEHYTVEYPNRVSYKKAIELTMSASLLILFGGMEPYYSASKLMGMIASRKPFVAFLHKKSFPAKFLLKLKYKYIVCYSDEEKPKTKEQDLYNVTNNLINNLDTYTPIDINSELIIKHTAYGMTNEFVKPINNLLKNK